jgi:hypothetical protein
MKHKRKLPYLKAVNPENLVTPPGRTLENRSDLFSFDLVQRESVQSGMYLPMFRREILPQSSEMEQHISSERW